MSYINLLERTTALQNFNISDCLNIEQFITDQEVINALDIIKQRVSSQIYKKFKHCLIRFSFFIELTNPLANSDSTKYRTRWTNELHLDPRFATYDECLKIFKKLVNIIANIGLEELEILKQYCENSIFNVELPIDYIEKCMSNI